MPTCPNGHQSGSDDWCEVCGHRMAGAVPPPPPPPPTAGGGYGFPPPAPGAGGRPSAASQHEPELCPQCRTPREGGAPFCEECRWNFLTNTATSYTPAAPRPSAPAPDPRFPQGAGPQGHGPSYGAGDAFDYQSSRPSQVNRPAEPIPPSPFGAEPSGRAGTPGPGGQAGPGGGGGQATAGGPGGPGGPGAFPGAGGPGGPNGPSGPPAFGGSGRPGAQGTQGAAAGPGGFGSPGGHPGQGSHPGQGGHAGQGGHPGPGGQGGPSGPPSFGADPSRPVPPPPGPTPPAGPQATSGAPQAFMPPGPSGPGGMNGPSAPPSPSGFPRESGRPGPSGPAFGGGEDDWVISPPSHTSGGPGGYGYPQPGATQAPPAPGPAFPQQGQPPQPATWTATVGPDREYFMAMMQRSGPEAAGLNLPAYSPEQQRALTGNQVTIGRRRHSTGETPDIDLSVPPEDPGVSHQHAVLVQQPDGNWAVVDQNSTNGTTVNGGEEPIQPFVPVPLQDGDQVHVGAWTTITVRRG
ncbi:MULTISPECIES: FHA domain-containing protein [unclassified Streptomyces]|uniref:FHA domain-containing protein n=1 Tax=unclassified Streptomyces TaxID=2593676 RepID=UPI001F04BB47|nr:MULTISPECIES: FHA domain-containing protein [unclassified Streptomyces]MCH0564955.1 FHA domain-containing protein [Streptomyces sp. MUM 2J]MCH0569955.1 FHA domain-containing protein [Streptomyces sp. MUM 136J]